MKLTKNGYINRLIDKDIEKNLKLFGAISIEGRVAKHGQH